MRITSPTSSMHRPTYAISAPQGTFGATTPVTRSVAPAAAEIQRSGGGTPGRQFLTAVTALATSVSVAGCTESAVSEARSLVRQATPSIPSLPAIWKQAANEGPRLGAELASSIPSLDSAAAVKQIAQEGPKVPLELVNAAVGVVTNPVPALVETLAVTIPNPIAIISGDAASGGVSDSGLVTLANLFCPTVVNAVYKATDQRNYYGQICDRIEAGDTETLAKVGRKLRELGGDGSGAAWLPSWIKTVEGSPGAVEAAGRLANDITGQNSQHSPINLAGVVIKQASKAPKDPWGAVSSRDILSGRGPDGKIISFDTRTLNQEAGFTISEVDFSSVRPVIPLFP